MSRPRAATSRRGGGSVVVVVVIVVVVSVAVVIVGIAVIVVVIVGACAASAAGASARSICVPDVAGDQSLSPARLKASASTAATRGGVPVIQHSGVMSDQLAGRLERRAATNRSRCHGR